jgi:hypothetical protein
VVAASAHARRPPIPLDGPWRLELLDVPGAPRAVPAEVEVPGSWTLQVPGCETAHGTVRCSRTFTVPASWPADGVVLLRFGAVNHAAEVRVNGRRVGGHEGGWTPFEVLVPADLLTGADELLEVVVSYPPLLPARPGEPSLQEVPHGKQTWYGSGAGIWQPVTLEHRPRRHVASARVRTDAATGRVNVSVLLTEPVGASEEVAVWVRERTPAGEGPVVAHAAGRGAGAGDPRTVDLVAVVPAPRLWSPDAPHLYDVRVELREHDAPVDAVTVTTGLRSVATRGGTVLLNGEPIELRGVLDQDVHPGSALRTADVEELEELFGAVRRLGFTLLRCHIKRPDPVYFDVADRMGLLVWAELPSWQRFTPRSSAAAESLLEQMIALDGHHPSIVVWTVVNESWGMDVRDPDQRAWLRRTQQRAKELAPDALVVDNSACEPNFHVRSDLDDFHAYRGMPERRGSWDEWVDAFAARPAWTFSPHGDAERTGEEPLIASEFGNWGLPDMTDALGPDGADPWWAEAGLEWASGAAHASRVVDRFERLGLAEVFGSWAEFVAATQRQQSMATRYQIGSLRRRPEIAGYVLTQLSDVQWEANGLFDMDRRPRAFLDELALVNGPAAVVLRPSRYACPPGAEVALTVDVVPPRSAGHPDGEWTVTVSAPGAPPQARTVPAGRRTTLSLSVRLPDAVQVAAVRAELRAGADLLARDSADVAVLSPSAPTAERVQTSDDALGDWLARLGVPVVRTAGDDVLLLTRCFDGDAQAHARRGGRVLLLAEDRDALGGAFAAPLLARLSPRNGDGDWVPRFDWVRRSGPLAVLPGGPLLDLAYEHVLGDLVIEFLPAPLRPAHVHSAVFAGWLQHRASTTVTVPWSSGAVTITTLRLRGAGVQDAGAVALARALLAVAEQWHR